MKTFEQFKAEQGVTKIDFLQGKGRIFAKVKNTDVIISKECDLKKPLFVIDLTQDASGNPITNAVVVVNSANVNVAVTL